DARGFAAPGQKFLAQLDQAVRLCRSVTAAIAGAIDQGAATLRDGLEQFAEKRGVHSRKPRGLLAVAAQSGLTALAPAVLHCGRFSTWPPHRLSGIGSPPRAQEHSRKLPNFGWEH